MESVARVKDEDMEKNNVDMVSVASTNDDDMNPADSASVADTDEEDMDANADDPASVVGTDSEEDMRIDVANAVLQGLSLWQETKDRSDLETTKMLIEDVIGDLPNAHELDNDYILLRLFSGEGKWLRKDACSSVSACKREKYHLFSRKPVIFEVEYLLRLGLAVREGALGDEFIEARDYRPIIIMFCLGAKGKEERTQEQWNRLASRAYDNAWVGEYGSRPGDIYKIMGVEDREQIAVMVHHSTTMRMLARVLSAAEHDFKMIAKELEKLGNGRLQTPMTIKEAFDTLVDAEEKDDEKKDAAIYGASQLATKFMIRGQSSLSTVIAGLKGALSGLEKQIKILNEGDTGGPGNQAVWLPPDVDDPPGWGDRGEEDSDYVE